jgi:DNA (cytosine-5)-methyltransferase 1
MPTLNCDGYRSDGELRILARLFDEDELRCLADRAAESKIEKAIQTVPTITVCGNNNRKGVSDKAGDGLATFVKRFPTPTSHDAKDTNAPSERERNSPSRATAVTHLPTLIKSDADSWNNTIAEKRANGGLYVRLGNALTENGLPVGGKLNPDWSEFLMGFPIGWTKLEPLDQSVIRDWMNQASLWAEEPVPRIAMTSPKRSSRIAALGNAQVPHQAKLAWEILSMEEAK